MFYPKPYGVLNTESFARAPHRSRDPCPKTNLDLQSSTIAKLDDCHQCVSKIRALLIHQWQLHSTCPLVGKAGRTLWIWPCMANKGTSKTPLRIHIWSSTVYNSRQLSIPPLSHGIPASTRYLGLTADGYWPLPTAHKRFLPRFIGLP